MGFCSRIQHILPVVDTLSLLTCIGTSGYSDFLRSMHRSWFPMSLDNNGRIDLLERQTAFELQCALR
jgi:hypothetical protein